MQIRGACSHKDQAHDVQPLSEGCADCIAMGDTWVHLRMCVGCGYVGCCNDSKNKHAAQHFKDQGHPLMRSIEPGEDWGFCYLDNRFLKFAD